MTAVGHCCSCACMCADVPVFHSSTLERRAPVQSLPPASVAAQDVDSEMVEILIWSSCRAGEGLHTLLHRTFHIRMFMNEHTPTADNNKRRHLQSMIFFPVQYCLVDVFSPSPDQIIIIVFCYIYCTTLFLFIWVCNLSVFTKNTYVALEYLTKWWLAEQLLLVNTALEYCKTECRRALKK